MVVGTGRLYPTQAGQTSFQETTRHRGWSTSAVVGRSRRSVAVEKGQQRYDLSPHGDRRLLESGLVCSHEEQVRGVVGSLSVSGPRLVNGHSDKHLQPDHRSREF